MTREQKFEFFMNGNAIREIFGEIFSENKSNIRGFAHVVQFDERKIKSGFTTFAEYIEQGPMYEPNLWLEHERNAKEPFIGHVCYEVAQNGIMTRIAANYDSSD